MSATISDSFKTFERISRSLKIPINYYNLNSVKSIADSAIANIPIQSMQNLSNTLIPPINGISNTMIRETKYAKLFRDTLVTTSSINKIASEISMNLSNSNYQSAYERSLIVMRAFSTHNNHINSQWEKMINTQLNDQFITKFMDIENTIKVSSALGISEDNLKRMQDAINETYKNDNTGISKNDSAKTGQTSNDLKQVENKSNDISNKQKSSHSISPIFFIWLIVFLAPPAITLDGMIEKNNQELAVGSLLDLTVGAYERVKSELE